jgi:transcriptional antiterminator RfaH
MTYQDRSPTWFLAQLKPNSYRIAERNLQRQFFRTFLPMHEETSRRNGKFVSSMKPLFPGYLFVAIDTFAGDWHKINSTFGVTRLVSFANQPAPVPGSLVSALKRRCDDSGKLLPALGLRLGDSVKLTSGPFAEFMAEIERIEPDRRVWVLLDLMGRTTRLAIDADALEVQ